MAPENIWSLSCIFFNILSLPLHTTSLLKYKRLHKIHISTVITQSLWQKITIYSAELSNFNASTYMSVAFINESIDMFSFGI